jgi:hypothetical protein
MNNRFRMKCVGKIEVEQRRREGTGNVNHVLLSVRVLIAAAIESAARSISL